MEFVFFLVIIVVSILLMWCLARHWVRHDGQQMRLSLWRLFGASCIFALVWTITGFIVLSVAATPDTVAGFLLVWAVLNFPTAELLLSFWKHEKSHYA